MYSEEKIRASSICRHYFNTGKSDNIFYTCENYIPEQLFHRKNSTDIIAGCWKNEYWLIKLISTLPLLLPWLSGKDKALCDSYILGTGFQTSAAI